MKQCNKCGNLLPFEKFSRHSGANYLRPECKQCNNELSRDRAALRRIYDQPDENYCCPICLKTADQLQGRGGRAGVWVLDHDHETKGFRGWLCHSCNRALGCFLDDVELLNRAILYLNGEL